MTLHHADFPIWRIMRDGSPVPHQGPLINFDAKPGLYRIERVTIWQEKVGAIVSLLAALLLALTQFPVRTLTSFVKPKYRHGPAQPYGS